MSHFTGDSNPLSRHRYAFAALAFVGTALAISGCSDDLKVPNQDARIVLVGDLSTASEACGFDTTSAQALDAGAGSSDGGTDDTLQPDLDAVGPADTTDAGDSDASSGEDVSAEDATGEDATGEDATSEDATGEDATSEDATSEDATGEDATSEDATSEDATGEDAISEDASSEEDAAGEDDDGSNPLPSWRAELERDGDMLAIPYLIFDREADSQSIQVDICLWDAAAKAATECGVAIAGVGGGGASGISTTPGGQCVLHVFNWDVGCGRFTGVDSQSAVPARASVNVEDEIIVRISVVGSKETPGESAPFTLKALGFDALPRCE